MTRCSCCHRRYDLVWGDCCGMYIWSSPVMVSALCSSATSINMNTITLATPSTPKNVSQARIMPHGATMSCSLWVHHLLNCAQGLVGEDNFWLTVPPVPFWESKVIPSPVSSSSSNSKLSSLSEGGTSVSVGKELMGLATQLCCKHFWSWKKPCPRRICACSTAWWLGRSHALLEGTAFWSHPTIEQMFVCHRC